jgi:hypothetical protein
MSNARVRFEMDLEGQTGWATNGGGGGVPVTCFTIEDDNVCLVLELNQMPRTLVFVIHEEAVN